MHVGECCPPDDNMTGCAAKHSWWWDETFEQAQARLPSHGTTLLTPLISCFIVSPTRALPKRPSDSLAHNKLQFQQDRATVSVCGHCRRIMPATAAVASVAAAVCPRLDIAQAELGNINIYEVGAEC